jgi:hypothetical protein
LQVPANIQQKTDVKRRLSESAIIADVSQRACQRLAHKVIGELQRMDDALLSPEGSGLQNTWDEICVQVQHEESFSWRAYDDTVRALVDGLVAELRAFERESIWLQTPEGTDWDCEEPEQRESNPVYDSDITNYLLREYIYSAAANWSNSRIRAYLDQRVVHD